jgi:hypothetical protein
VSSFHNCYFSDAENPSCAGAYIKNLKYTIHLGILLVLPLSIMTAMNDNLETTYIA